MWWLSMTEVHLCKGGGLCTCKESHRGTVCQIEVPTGKKIQEKGKEYYKYHEKDSDDPKERWINETKPCKNKGKFRTDCNSFFEHKAVLCNKHYKERIVWYNKACGICGSPHRSCCC